MKRSKLLSQLAALLAAGLVSLTGTIPAYAEQAVNPASIATLTTISGPEKPGFHDCFWIGPVSYDSYNNAFPDEGAIYWGANFKLPDNAAYIELKGYYPKTRYMSYNTYNKKMEPIDGLADIEIKADKGANPYTSTDKSGGSYSLKLYGQNAPELRTQNALYLGDKETRNRMIPLLYRLYVPEGGSDLTGDAGLPQASLVMNDGTRLSGQAMCDAVNSPKIGTERKSPTVLVKEDTYYKTISGAGTKPGFPAQEKAEWIRFWGSDTLLGRLFPDRIYLDKALAGAKAGTMKKQSGFYANTHNDYISTYVHESFGKVVILRGKLPRTPEQGWDVASGVYDMRYWSICTNESVITTKYSDCKYDSQVTTDKDGYFTIIISKEENRPANAKAECGMTWLDWGEAGDGARDPQLSYILIRNMLGNDFAHSIQNITDPSDTGVRATMGDYFPETRYSSKAQVEAMGCTN